MMPSYEVMKTQLKWIVEDMNRLSGDAVGQRAWQAVAKDLAANMRTYADNLEKAADGKCAGPIIFPSLTEIMEDL